MRVSWVTNLAAPYRLPVWTSLGAREELSVWLLSDTEPGRRWKVPDGEGYALRLLSTLRRSRGQTTLYWVSRASLRSVLDTDVLVLGGWEPPAFVQIVLAARRRRIPYVLFYESTLHTHRFRRGPLAALRRWIFSSAGAVLVPGPAAAEAVRAMGVPDERIVVSFNAVDVRGICAAAAAQRGQLAADGSAAQSKSDFESGAESESGRGHVFLFLGMLLPNKRPDLILQSFARVARPGDRLILAGAGPEEGRLRALVHELGLSASVEFAGYVEPEDLPVILARSNTLVLASKLEVWGLVVNEALAAGLHAVVMEHIGVAASVGSMPGVFVCADSEPAVAAAMAASRAAWTGPIGEPEILRHGPQELATDALRAIEIATSTGRERSAPVPADRPTAVWVTNVVSPYRARLWTTLACDMDLHVVVLDAGVRFGHWRKHPAVDGGGEGYTLHRRPARVLRRGEVALYGPARGLRRLLNDIRPDVVLVSGWEGIPYLQALWWSRRRKVPVLGMYGSTRNTHRIARGPLAWARAAFWRATSGVVAYGTDAAGALRSFDVPAQRIRTSFNTVDVSAVAERARAHREEIGRGVDATSPEEPGHVYVFVGQLLARKNVAALVHAFAAIAAPADRLVIVGSGPEHHRLERVVARSGVRDQIDLRGLVDAGDVPHILAEAHTLVLPSVKEVWGLVVNEGLAAGLHVVVSSGCGVANDVRSMPGVFVSEPSVDSIADALRRSRQEWRGWIADPPILRHTPEVLAEPFRELVTAVTAPREKI